MTKPRTSIKELRVKIEQFAEENAGLMMKIEGLEKMLTRSQAEVEWLKSRWPRNASIEEAREGEEATFTPASLVDPPTESEGSALRTSILSALFVIALAVAAWQASLYWTGHVVKTETKPQAEAQAPPEESRKSEDAPPEHVDYGTAPNPLLFPQLPASLSLTLQSHLPGCWVQASYDGNVGAFTFPSPLTEENSTVTFIVENSIEVRDGCPGKLSFLLNGHLVHPTPEKGHDPKKVEVVRFTKGDN